jgi:hypothetical protein
MTRTVDCFRRAPDDHWTLYPYSTDDELELARLGFRTMLDAVYEDVVMARQS